MRANVGGESVLFLTVAWNSLVTLGLTLICFPNVERFVRMSSFVLPELSARL